MTVTSTVSLWALRAEQHRLQRSGERPGGRATRRKSDRRAMARAWQLTITGPRRWLPRGRAAATRQLGALHPDGPLLRPLA